MTESILVVGGGIAGLSAAWRLSRAGRAVRLLERNDRVGGVVHSVATSGYLFEHGPTTVPAAAPILRRLVEESGLADRAMGESEAAKRRYVWSHGELHAVPRHPLGLLRTRLLSVKGRLRLLAEPLIRDGSGVDTEETLASFFARRLGPETVRSLADPMVAGVFAARPEELGVEAFSRLAEWEREYGSVLKGGLAAARAARAAATSTSRQASDDVLRGRSLLSFPNGLEELPRALAAGLGDVVERSTEVLSLAPGPESSGGWRIELARPSGEIEHLQSAHVVLAVPVEVATRLIKGFSPAAATRLANIPQTPLAVVSLGFARTAIEHPLDGFGVLCASDSPLGEDGSSVAHTPSLLGVLFNSTVFSGRAPAGHVALTVMIGGTRDPAAVELENQELVAKAYAGVCQLLGATAPPVVSRVKRWPRAIPLYRPGHGREIGAVHDELARWPGLSLAGNYLEGVGLEAAAQSGWSAGSCCAEGAPEGR